MNKEDVKLSAGPNPTEEDSEVGTTGSMTRELYVYSTRICWEKLLSRTENTEEN